MDNSTQQKKFSISSLDILGIALIVLFLPIIIINLVLVIKGAVNPDEVPMVFDSAPLIVISDSMTIDEEAGTGAFNKGDLIIVKKVNPDDLDKGDIITYVSKEGDIITHRITDVFVDSETGERTFETKGDASPGYDYYAVKYDQIVGVYSSRLAGVGDIAMFFQTPTGVIVILGVPLLIMIGFDMYKKKQEKKASDDRTAELEAELARLKESQKEEE